MTSPIPIIDLAADSASIVQQLDQAYSRVGFAYLVNHGIEEQQLSQIFEASRCFHALPQEEKLKIEINRWHRGFIPINTSTIVTSSVDTVHHPNQSQSLMILHELPVDHPDSNHNTYLAGPNQWPESNPRLRHIALTYVAHMSQLCQRITGLLEQTLQYPNGYLTAHFENPTTFLRLLHYPPQKASDSAYGSAPHTDYGFITLLAQDDIGGLQVKTPNGQWLDVPPLQGAFIMNAGDMLQHWSGGRLIATPHRVINTSNVERYSVPFFYDPHVRTNVLAWGQWPNHHRDHDSGIIFGQYLRERLEKNHTQHG